LAKSINDVNIFLRANLSKLTKPREAPAIIKDFLSYMRP